MTARRYCITFGFFMVVNWIFGRPQFEELVVRRRGLRLRALGSVAPSTLSQKLIWLGFFYCTLIFPNSFSGLSRTTSLSSSSRSYSILSSRTPHSTKRCVLQNTHWEYPYPTYPVSSPLLTYLFALRYHTGEKGGSGVPT
jgi:hypothetical protein